MRIRLEIESLWEQVRRISDTVVDFDPHIELENQQIVIELQKGIEVQLEDLTYDGGLISFKGHQVFLYIPDQGVQIHEVLKDPEAPGAKRFHVADCATLNNMRTQGRFARYTATNRLDGRFKLTGRSMVTNDAVEGEGSLMVCQNCLKLLNYKDFLNLRKAQRQDAWLNFSIAEFFEKFSTHFRYLPSDVLKGKNGSAYSDDWKDVSGRIREERGWRCDQCGIQLAAHKHLLHVHHVNGVRGDNRPENLRPLCVDCHRKQPLHDTMFVSSEDMAAIRTLRRSQNVVADGWSEALALADTAIEGALQLARAKGFDAPVVGYELAGPNGKVAAEFEAAWPNRRIALVVHETAPQKAWTVLRSVDFIRKFG